MESERIWRVTARPVTRNWWEEHRGLQAALFGLLLLMLAVAAHAQQPPITVAQNSFSCAADAGWILDDGASFIPEAQRPSELPVDARAVSFSGYDAAEYGVAAVEFYSVVSTTDARATMTLFLHEVAADGAARWYRYSVSPAAEFMPAAAGQQPLPFSAAAPQAGVPLFHLGFYSLWNDAGQAGATGDVLVLDLGHGEPRTVQHLNCSTAQQQPAQTATSCQWDAARADYTCSDTTALDGGWTRRTSSRRYWLLKDEAAFVHAAGQPRSVAEFAARLARRRFRGDRASIEGAGDVRLLATWMPGGDGHRIFLFAARGAGDRMSARFFAASLDGNGEGSTAEIPVRDFSGAGFEPERARWSDDEMPAGDPLQYRVSELAVAGALRVLQVQVDEGSGQGVFWVAVDTSRLYLQADVLRVSAEVLLPGRGTVLARDEGALQAQVIPGDAFSAALLARSDTGDAAISPAHAAPPCAWQLTWNGSWVLTKRDCAAAPQQQISAVAAN